MRKNSFLIILTSCILLSTGFLAMNNTSVVQAKILPENKSYVAKLPQSYQQNFENIENQAQDTANKATGIVNTYQKYALKVGDEYYNAMAYAMKNDYEGREVAIEKYLDCSDLLNSISNYCSDANLLNSLLTNDNKSQYISKFNEIDSDLIDSVNSHEIISEDGPEITKDFNEADSKVKDLIVTLNRDQSQANNNPSTENNGLENNTETTNDNKSVADSSNQKKAKSNSKKMLAVVKKNSIIHVPSKKYAAFMRTKSKIKSGSKVRLLSSVISNGICFDKVARNKYIRAVNLKGKKRKLKKDAYIIFPDGGKLRKLKKGQKIMTYGLPVEGYAQEKFYVVKKSRLVKKSAFVD